MRSKSRLCLVITSILVAVVCFGYTGQTLIKAHVAQALIAHAWHQSHFSQHDEITPWPWADMYVLARLHLPGDRGSFYVLSDANGESLAFGPSHILPSALPGQTGTTVIAAHNDTHFKHLSTLRLGDIIGVEEIKGKITRYQVRQKLKRTPDHLGWPIDPNQNQLHLITCLRSQPERIEADQRLIIIADRVEG